MRDADTTLDEGARRFPETAEDLLAGLRGGRREEVIRDVLGRRYWRPVYAYVRAAWRKDNEDAKDLTQAFFLWLLESDVLLGFAELGSFRKYLKVLLQRFVGHQEEALGRLKRGGGRKLLAMDGTIDVPDPAAAEPGELFDRAWWTELVNAAMDRVRERRPPDFAVYEAYELAPERPSYAALAARFGIDEREVKRRLFATRDALQAEIRRELALLTRGEAELREEWDALFGA